MYSAVCECILACILTSVFIVVHECRLGYEIMRITFKAIEKGSDKPRRGGVGILGEDV